MCKNILETFNPKNKEEIILYWRNSVSEEFTVSYTSKHFKNLANFWG